MIWAAPRPFILALIAATGLIWLAMQWRYNGIIENNTSANSLVTAQRDDYKEKLGGASPEQAKARIDGLEKKVAELNARLGPPYPLADEEKDRLARTLEGVPPNERFRVPILWPVINGIARYANQLAQVFVSANWDAPVEPAPLSYGHGITIWLTPNGFSDTSKRSPETVRLIALLTQAKIRFDIQPNNSLLVPFALVVGVPE